METTRSIHKVLSAKPTREGAGVKLNRVFGYYENPLLDPFLLLDDFGSDNPDDYLAGFPWHPHRGIETVTYMMHGVVEHGDSIGNEGIIESGDVQWMTAGSGIVHQEMPRKVEGHMRGFQLWVNLPGARKMMQPRYQEIKKDQIPEMSINENVSIKIIAGTIYGTRGPVKDLIVETEFLDISMKPRTSFEKNTRSGDKVFAYVFEGQGLFHPDQQKLVKQGQLVIFDNGEKIVIETSGEPVRFLLVSGAPLNEPVAWRGPIVMNSQEELDVAFQEFRNGTFIKNQ